MVHSNYLEQIAYGDKLKQERLEKRIKELEVENAELRKENNDLHIILNVKQR